MFKFRSMLNADPPALAEVWRSQLPLRGRMQPMSARLFEICVFSKQYFSPAGFIVAVRDNEPIGFVHVGFGPNDSGQELSTDVGVVEMAMLHPSHDDPALADELLHQGETHLRNQGAKRIVGGGRRPLSQFYLGLYGGSDLPGVLESDAWQTELLLRNGYAAIEEIAVLQRDLVNFRPPVSRDARRLGREVNFLIKDHTRTDTWWDAQQHSEQQVVRFELAPRKGGGALSSVSAWDIEPLATGWGVSTAGVIDLQTSDDQRRRGVATYLLAEVFRELRTRGVAMVECQVSAENQPAMKLCEKLGLTRIDTGRLYELMR